MRAKKLVACALSAAMMLGLASMTGCGSAKKDYDLYIYNTKSEIADSIQDLCKDYETETGWNHMRNVGMYGEGIPEDR